ncbi:DUF6924 domain-containing protein [Streptomyces sp. NPDC003016]
MATSGFLADPSHPLLAVDLYDEPGRTFRVPARWCSGISAHLSIADLDFTDFTDVANAREGSATFRGFGGTRTPTGQAERPVTRGFRPVSHMQGVRW